jgi:hypothetical protein
MQSVDNNNSINWQYAEWQLINEFTLFGEVENVDREVERASTLVLESMRGLGFPRSYLGRIKVTLEDIARKAIKRNAQIGSVIPLYICLYIQKRGRDEARGSEVRAKENNACQEEEPVLDIPESGGGWGYFLTERLVDRSSLSSDNWHYSIEIFLYVEGR